MKKFLTIVAIAGLFVACAGEQGAENEQTEVSVETTSLPQIALGEFDTKASEFVDKEVMVQGIVDHVCKHGGKKIFLVTDEGDVHINSESRFNDSLAGSEIFVTGIVRELRIDESTCLKDEEDNIKSHGEGKKNDEQFEHKKKQIALYRDSMNNAGIDHLSFYSLEYVSHKEAKTE